MNFWHNEKFIRNFNQGNEKAYLKVYDFFAPKIFRFVYYKTGKNKELAEDITQQAFIKIWQYIISNKENKIDNIQAFLYQVARNLVIDNWREQQKEPLPIIEESIEIAEEPIHQIKIDKKIQLDTLEKNLEKIPEQYKEIIIMRYLEELSIEEIEVILGKDKNSIYVLIHRALKALKKKINKVSNI